MPVFMGATIANNICFAKITCGDGQRLFAQSARMPPRKARARNENYRKSGELIAARRGELELTQDQLAAQLKVKRQNVQHWEKGAALPRPELMRALGNALGLTIDEITSGEVAGVREPPQQYALELTPNALTIARIWDGLPQAGQNYIAEQLDAMLRFQAEDRDMAAYVFSTPALDTMKRLKEHEKLLELAQDKARRVKAK